jgi:hypothetical protein
LNPNGQAAVGRPRVWLLVQVALFIGYLDAVFWVIPRDYLRYKFNQLLFDYAHGLARRSLEGEILRHLVAPPYSLGFFREFAGVQTLVALLLFAVVAGVVAARSSSVSRLLLALVILSSPTTFKNMVFDLGRQDAIGVIVLEVAVLLGLARSQRMLPAFVSVVTLPLALMNENLLLLYVPACLAIHGSRLAAGWRGRAKGVAPALLGLAPFAVFAASCLVCVFLPSPTIPRDAYRAYLQTKSIGKLDPGQPERWLYSGAAENFEFARGEWAKFAHLQREGLPQYLVFGAVLALACVLVARSLKDGEVRGRRLYLAGLFAILPGYAVLFLGASDIARWFANLNLAMLVFSFWYLSWSEAEPPAPAWRPLIPVAAVQLFLFGGFGVVFPAFDLAGDFARFLSLF